MSQQNRVTPFGEIVAIAQRGQFLGNRGCLHRPGERTVARRWQVRRWITCALEHKGWRAPRWEPGRWTALFFWDEAVALAAGHRPCALCRRADFTRWMDGWETAFGARPPVDLMDRRLHEERVGDDRRQRRHAAAWRGLPVGTFAVVDGVQPVLVLEDRLVPWSAVGYGPSLARPATGTATVLTPASSVEVLRRGYRPDLHPEAATGPSRATRSRPGRGAASRGG